MFFGTSPDTSHYSPLSRTDVNGSTSWIKPTFNGNLAAINSLFTQHHFPACLSCFRVTMTVYSLDYIAWTFNVLSQTFSRPASNNFYSAILIEPHSGSSLGLRPVILMFWPTSCVHANTLNAPGSEIDPERVHWGQTPFRVNDDPEISQLDAECDPELGQSDPIICQVCRKLTKFRVIFDPEWSLGPNGPFSGSRWSGCF